MNTKKDTVVEIMEVLDDARKWGNLVDVLFDQLISDQLGQVHVQKRFRIKNQKSLLKKIEAKSQEKPYSLDQVTDLVGFRFVCHFQNEVEKVVDALLQHINPTNSHFKFLKEASIYVTSAPNQKALVERLEHVFKKHGIDIKIEEKLSRYTSVHMVISFVGSRLFEVQVRNVFEDAWSEIEHALKYKVGSSDLSPSVNRHLQILNTFAQACSEYSESILLDSQDDTPSASPSVFELNDDEAELRGLSAPVRSAFKAATDLRKKEKCKEAISVLSEFITANADLFERDAKAEYFLLMERGICALKLGKCGAAISDYEMLLAKNPDRALIYYRLGDAYRIDRDFRIAASYFEQVPVKLASTVNTKQEKQFLQRWPYTLAHAYWRLKEPKRSLEILDHAIKTGQIPWKNAELKHENCYVYYLIEAARESNQIPDAQILTKSYLLMKKMGVMDGSHWAELDTFAVLCELLDKQAEALECIDLLEAMLIYENEGEAPKIKYKGGIMDVPLEEIEIVRSHIDRIKRKFTKKVMH